MDSIPLDIFEDGEDLKETVPLYIKVVKDGIKPGDI